MVGSAPSEKNRKNRDARATTDPLSNGSKGIDMAIGLNKVVHHLHQILSSAEGGLTDAQLLARFVAVRDEGSFAALVRRHGPMVLSVCRRLLRHDQDAEDAFQATFLVLARRAPVVQGESVGAWLHSVAHRTALEARAQKARRLAHEKQVDAMPHPEVMPTEFQDWRPLLDQELTQLPKHYRSVVVLCDLEGQSRKEAARQLGLAEGTLSSRLARARQLLAKRMARYGLTMSGGALATALSEGVSASVPAPLVQSTVRAALLVATGQLVSVTTPAAVLMKGVMKTMFLAKLKRPSWK
jgi:RNA polymerase sigma factor (sigma-70 family)